MSTVNTNLATLTEASNLLLGLDRKLTKTQAEPSALPQLSPIPATIQVANSGFGETTRQKRNVLFSDAGWGANQARIDSAYQFVQHPVCDVRPTQEMFGDSSRLVGRSPMLRRSS